MHTHAYAHTRIRTHTHTQTHTHTHTNLLTLTGKGIGGLAVDWINDKLYWTDRSNLRIEVYDLHTSKRSTIVSTGAGSLPLGLAIYPYPGHG